RGGKKSSCVYGACTSRFNGNTERRCCRCACDWADALALAGSRKLRNSGSNTDMNAAVADLRVRWLGRMKFQRALALQEEIVLKKRNYSLLEDQLLLLEHEPVYTIGRTPDRSSLSAGRRAGQIRSPQRGAAHLPHPLFAINRGGQATYHGPGQLMGYPIIDLRRCGQDLHKYLRWLEQLLIDLLAKYDIAAHRRESLTGVWIENRKIASIGVGVRHWVTMQALEV